MKKWYRIKDTNGKMWTFRVRGEEVGQVKGQDGKVQRSVGEKRKSRAWRQCTRREGGSVMRRDCDENEISTN
jgi:hypothetical protein